MRGGCFFILTFLALNGIKGDIKTTLMERLNHNPEFNVNELIKEMEGLRTASRKGEIDEEGVKRLEDLEVETAPFLTEAEQTIEEDFQSFNAEI
jgi:hypothetical protein